MAVRAWAQQWASGKTENLVKEDELLAKKYKGFFAKINQPHVKT
jgi:hypothetical protein